MKQKIKKRRQNFGNILTFVTALIFSSFILENGFAQNSSPIEVAVNPEKLELTQGKTGEFSVDIKIPQEHHAYLNEGDEGFFIPISIKFDTKHFSSIKVEAGTRPVGTREDYVKAQVLRGEGKFPFTITAYDHFEGELLIKVMSQICNDITKICYPPKQHKLIVPIISKHDSNYKGNVKVNNLAETETSFSESPLSIGMIVGIILLIISLGFLFNRLGGKSKNISRSFGVVLLIAAMFIMSKDLIPLMNGNGNNFHKEEFEQHGNLTWHRNFDDAIEKAKKEKKPVFIDFYAYWCSNCLAFRELSLSDKILNSALQSAVLLKVYDTDTIFEDFKMKKEYSLLNIGLPFFALLRSDGTFYWKTTKYDDVTAIDEKISELLSNK
ncbi:MAG: thioredoxin family protein [Nitrospinae bacterium]|nr:thioredoxin family protein [Nitrospinota bacterium]